MSLLASSVFAAGCPKAAETAASAAVSAATGVDVKVSSKGGVPQMAANYNVDGAHVAVNAGGATQVPAGFPFPVADGLTLQQATTSTEQGRPRFLVSGMTSKTPREVADFYEPLLKAKGLTVTRNEMNMGGTASIHLSASDDTRSASVSITNVGGTNMVAITSEGVR
jgi:hypothetical protein